MQLQWLETDPAPIMCPDFVPAPRVAVSYPEKLDVRDLEAILAQTVELHLSYRIDGWILRAMAGELLALKAGPTPTGFPAVPGTPLVPPERAPRRQSQKRPTAAEVVADATT